MTKNEETKTAAEKYEEFVKNPPSAEALLDDPSLDPRFGNEKPAVIKLAGTYGKYAGIETMREAKQALHAKDAEIAEANARLIASAPEMLEALDACLSELEDWNFGHESSEGQLLARAAIAKAEGGAS